MGPTLWKRCLERLEGELPPQQFNTWIRPLHAVEDDGALRLLAPNTFVRDWINEHLASHIADVAGRSGCAVDTRIVVEVGRARPATMVPPQTQIARNRHASLPDALDHMSLR